MRESIPYQTLEYVLTSYPNLQCFELSCTHSTGFVIKATRHNYTDGTIRALSTTTQDNLKRIKMQPFALSQSLLDLLSKHLPDIEHLICVDCGYTNSRSFAAAAALEKTMKRQKRLLSHLS
jgi:hypothetical protein